MNHIKTKINIFQSCILEFTRDYQGCVPSLALSLSPLICCIRIRITKMIYFRKWIEERVVQRASPTTCWPSRHLILQHFAAILYFNVRQTNSCAGLKRTRFWSRVSAVSGWAFTYTCCSSLQRVSVRARFSHPESIYRNSCKVISIEIFKI